MAKKAKSLTETLKAHSSRPTQIPKSKLVHVGAIKSKPQTVAPSKRIGGARGGSA
jgi:hypothetical protein